jgi:hypothetical protein
VNRADDQSDVQSLLDAYLRDLDSALAGLPRARRTQLVSEIRQHVDAALTEQPPRSPAEMRNLLDRVGRAEDIAAAALEEEPGPARRPLRTRQKVLIASACALVLAGLGVGLAFALTSRQAPGGATAQGSHTPRPSVAATTRAPRTAPTKPAPSNAATTPASAPPSASPATETSGLRTILAPATVPPVKDECTEQLVFGADGNVRPLTCPDGGVNTAAWKQLAVPGSELLALGLYATPSQVYEATCHDFEKVYKTKPITESAEEIAQAYYQWQFGVNPLSEFEQLGCPKS